jgi:hypothetical protein
MVQSGESDAAAGLARVRPISMHRGGRSSRYDIRIQQ